MNYEGMIYRPPSEAYSLILQVTVGLRTTAARFVRCTKKKAFM